VYISNKFISQNFGTQPSAAKFIVKADSDDYFLYDYLTADPNTKKSEILSKKNIAKQFETLVKNKATYSFKYHNNDSITFDSKSGSIPNVNPHRSITSYYQGKVYEHYPRFALPIEDEYLKKYGVDSLFQLFSKWYTLISRIPIFPFLVYVIRKALNNNNHWTNSMKKEVQPKLKVEKTNLNENESVKLISLLEQLPSQFRLLDFYKGCKGRGLDPYTLHNNLLLNTHLSGMGYATISYMIEKIESEKDGYTLELKEECSLREGTFNKKSDLNLKNIKILNFEYNCNIDLSHLLTYMKKKYCYLKYSATYSPTSSDYFCMVCYRTFNKYRDTNEMGIMPVCHVNQILDNAHISKNIIKKETVEDLYTTEFTTKISIKASGTVAVFKIPIILNASIHIEEKFEDVSVHKNQKVKKSPDVSEINSIIEILKFLGGLDAVFNPSEIEISPIDSKTAKLIIECSEDDEKTVKKFSIKLPKGLNIELPETITFKGKVELDVPISCDESCAETEHSVPLTLVLDDDTTADTSILVKIKPKFILSSDFNCDPKRAKGFDTVNMTVSVKNDGYMEKPATLTLELFDSNNNSIFKDSKNFNTEKFVSLQFSFPLGDVPNDTFKPGPTVAQVSITVNGELVHTQKFDAFDLMKKIDLSISGASALPSGNRIADIPTTLKCNVLNKGYSNVEVNVFFTLKDSSNEIFMSNSENPLKLNIPSEGSKTAELMLSSLTPKEPFVNKQPAVGDVSFSIKAVTIDPKPDSTSIGTAETELKPFKIKPDFDLNIINVIPSFSSAIAGSTVSISVELFNNGGPIKPNIEIKLKINGSGLKPLLSSDSYVLQSLSIKTYDFEFEIPEDLHGSLSIEVIASDQDNESNKISKNFPSIINIINKSNLDRICNICGLKISSSTLYCPNCRAEQKSTEVIICSKCSNVMPFRSVKCPHCNYYNRSRFDHDLTKCPKCASIGLSGKFCTVCGTKLPEPRPLDEVIEAYAKGFSIVKDLKNAIKFNVPLLSTNPNARVGLLKSLINKMGEKASKRIGDLDSSNPPSFKKFADIVNDLLELDIRQDLLSDDLKQQYSKIELLKKQIFNKKLELSRALVQRDKVFNELKDSLIDVSVDSLKKIPLIEIVKFLYDCKDKPAEEAIADLIKNKLFDLALSAGLGPHKVAYDAISALLNKAKLLKSTSEYIESNQEIKKLESEISELEVELVNIQ